MAFQSKQIFVNLPVKDLNKSVEFFTALGFEFNPQFTDENATCMIIGDGIYAMLLVESFFKTFTQKEIANTATTTEVILALSAESRDQVDEFVQKALDNGGKPYNDKIDHGFMYTWSFQDVDGHLWEIMHMDESAVHQG
ncbi:VOC family protein [Paenibacillus filicis]|uniref:VOC family protein n=1 Tax=Paenibacillus filicis TaxID=669464 RepID=A0ABU9DCS8_9BACL